jgi:hypothetical protein
VEDVGGGRAEGDIVGLLIKLFYVLQGSEGGPVFLMPLHLLGTYLCYGVISQYPIKLIFPSTCFNVLNFRDSMLNCCWSCSTASSRRGPVIISTVESWSNGE